MFLHDNVEFFNECIDSAAVELDIPRSIVEKDYYVFIVLKLINAAVGDEIIFKGGTSLSKAHGIIKRFSEDIDLCLIDSKIKSKTARGRLSRAVLSAFGQVGSSVSSPRDIQIHGVYNKLVGEYSSLISDNENNTVKSNVIVEIANRVKEYPYSLKEVDSYIGRYISNKYGEKSLDTCGLSVFQVNTISIYRTFVDKLFAIADYYMMGKNKRYSRHLYDLYKIINYIDLSDISVVSGIQQLLGRVRIDRQASRNCVSAQQGINLSQVIMEALSKDFYKDDYNNITSNILYEKITYEECKYTILKFLCLIQV